MKRKPIKNTPTTFTVRVDKQTYERLMLLSEKNLRSYGKQIRLLVDREFDEAIGETSAQANHQTAIPVNG